MLRSRGRLTVAIACENWERSIGVVVERHHRGIAGGLRAEQNALGQLQVARAVLLERLARLGDVGRDVRRVAPVLHEDAAQRAVGRAFAIVEDEAERQVVEGAGAGEIGDEVGADEGREVLDRAEAPRQELHVDRRDRGEHRRPRAPASDAAAGAGETPAAAITTSSLSPLSLLSV